MKRARDDGRQQYDDVVECIRCDAQALDVKHRHHGVISASP
jgi:hypothetical protein